MEYHERQGHKSNQTYTEINIKTIYSLTYLTASHQIKYTVTQSSGYLNVMNKSCVKEHNDAI